MSKKKKNTKKPIPQNPAAFDRLNYLSAAPGLLMCFLTALVFVLDIFIPDTFSKQYSDYPAMFDIFNMLIAISGIAFWIISIRRRRGIIENSIGKVSTAFFVLFLSCIAISTLINGLDEKAIHGIPYRNIGVFRILLLISVYMMLSACLNSAYIQNLIVSGFLIISDFIAISVIADKYFINIHAYDSKKDISAIFFNGNHYGYFLVMAALLGVGYFLKGSNIKHRILGGVSILLNLFVLIMNGSSGCLIAFTAALCITLAVSFFTDKRTTPYCIALCAAFVLSGLLAEVSADSISSIAEGLIEDVRLILSGGNASYSAGHNRWLLWSVTCKYIMQKPLFGFGCEGLDSILMSETGRGNPHNEILSYASQFGIPAAVFYVCGAVSVMIRSVREFCSDSESAFAAFAAAVGYFISSIFGVPMFYTLPFFFVFLGLSCSSAKKSDRI